MIFQLYSEAFQWKIRPFYSFRGLWFYSAYDKDYPSRGGRHLLLEFLLKSEQYGNVGQKGRWLAWPHLDWIKRAEKSRVLHNGSIPNPAKERISCLPIGIGQKRLSQFALFSYHSNFKRPYTQFPMPPEPSSPIKLQVLMKVIRWQK